MVGSARRAGRGALAFLPQNRDFNHTRRVARTRNVLALKPLLTNHPCQYRAADAGRAAQTASRTGSSAIRKVIQHAKFSQLFLGRATRARRRSRRAAQMQAICPLR